MIPLINLKRQYTEIKPELDKAIQQVFENGSYVQSKMVGIFEENFKKAHQSEHAIGCSNGTSALSLALEALGVSTGDEVLVPTHTFIATAEAVCHVGAKPVFVDIDEATYTFSFEDLEKKMTPKTKAIIPVHIYGLPVNMTRLMGFAKSNSLKVVEDCAQAHLATYENRSIGSFGDAATFSFYPGKNLGAYGDAGMVLVQNEETAKRVRMLVNHGRFNKKYEHDIVGYNQRMDELQAALLDVKLKLLPQWTKRRNEVAAAYREVLGNKFKTSQPIESAYGVYHLFVVEVQNRDECLQKLKDNGVGAGIHYPIPLHLQPAYSFLNYKKQDFPAAEKISDRILSLPICGSISDNEIDEVSSKFLKAAQAF